jgi:hypothetical protein
MSLLGHSLVEKRTSVPVGSGLSSRLRKEDCAIGTKTPSLLESGLKDLSSIQGGGL